MVRGLGPALLREDDAQASLKPLSHYQTPAKSLLSKADLRCIHCPWVEMTFDSPKVSCWKQGFGRRLVIINHLLINYRSTRKRVNTNAGGNEEVKAALVSGAVMHSLMEVLKLVSITETAGLRLKLEEKRERELINNFGKWLDFATYSMKRC